MVKKIVVLFVLCAFLFAKESTRYDEYFSQIGSHFGIPPMLLKKIAKIESNLNERCIGVNKNKTVDYGLMQINSCHFKELAPYGIGEHNIMNPKVNITAAAILLKKYVAKDGFNFYEIGKYHSHTSKFKSIWNDRLAKELAKEF
jgi:soluble lytic murein transglycosylase-like protein